MIFGYLGIRSDMLSLFARIFENSYIVFQPFATSSPLSDMYIFALLPPFRDLIKMYQCYHFKNWISRHMCLSISSFLLNTVNQKHFIQNMNLTKKKKKKKNDFWFPNHFALSHLTDENNNFVHQKYNCYSKKSV